MSAPDTLPGLLSRLAAALAEELAPRLAAELATRQPARGEPAPASARLLSLDELIERLPRDKPPKTWKRWLYERSRKGQIPGCHKLGGRLYFDPQTLETWLTPAPESPSQKAGKSTG